ncbi:hypothetical protein [Dyella nitratireducens]|nr:hypothetical protein [Dyella nitratireducens]
MSDDELQKYAASAQLDEHALSLLVAELNRRGLLPQGTGHAPNTGNEIGASRPNYLQLVRGLSPLNAQILLGRLRVEGVDAHLSGANIVQVDPLWFYALGGVRVFVHRGHLATAFDVLNATWKGDYAVVDAEEASAPVVDRLNDKRLLGWKIVLWVALVIGGTSLAALWWPLYQQFAYPTAPALPAGAFGRGMASVLLMAYVAFWLFFVNGVVRRQRRP